MGINHVYTSPQADVGDPTLVQPSNWNSVHAYSLQDAASLSGNTAGVLANISTGTLYLAGGNNVTLSQAGNSVTISAANSGTAPPIGTAVKGVSSIGSTGTVTRFAPEDHQHAGLHSLNVGGNTAGATSAGAGSFMLAGGNNITLSGATAAGGMTLTVSGGAVVGIGTSVESVASASSVGTVTRYAPEDHRHEGLYKISVAGNTAGGNTTAGGGSLVLAGGPNITLSGATAAGGMTLSISGAAAGAGGLSAGVSTGGNTVGTSGTVASQLVLVGGSNITLSQSVNGASATLTISQSNAALAYWVPTDQQVSTTKDYAASMSSIFLVHVLVPTEMTINKVAMLNSMQTNVTSAVSNTTYGFTISRGVALYSYNGQSLAMASSSSATPTVSYTSANSTNSLQGIRLHTMPLAATLTPGNWWIAFSYSSSAIRTASNSSAGTTVANSYYIGADALFPAVNGVWSSAADTNVRFVPFQGVYSAVSAAFPNSIGSTEINTSASQNLYFQLHGAISG